MDIDTQAQTTGQINDDQELAKALAGFNNNVDFEETPPIVPPVPTPTDDTEGTPEPEATKTPSEDDEQHVTNNAPVVIPTAASASANVNLDDIKKDALLELRPLMDKLDLKSEEKFDIYLLLLRSTDDKALIAPAHEAARNISDETKRAQALLDIIKEIDYLSSPKN